MKELHLLRRKTLIWRPRKRPQDQRNVLVERHNGTLQLDVICTKELSKPSIREDRTPGGGGGIGDGETLERDFFFSYLFHCSSDQTLRAGDISGAHRTPARTTGTEYSSSQRCRDIDDRRRRSETYMYLCRLTRLQTKCVSDTLNKKLC